MKTVIGDIITAIHNNKPVMLCSILANAGSSPRGAGARMAVFEDGSFSGTIGGGAVEHIVIGKAAEDIKKKRFSLVTYSMEGGEQNDTNMICGGTVTVCFQPMRKKDLPVLEKLLSILEKDCNAWLTLRLSDRAVTEFSVFESNEIPDKLRAFCSHTTYFKKGRYMEPISRKGTVYVFGGGHVGKALVPVLASVDFRVVVFDNRAYLAKSENFPAAQSVICGEYENFAEKINLTEDDYVVIMTPGHQADFEVLCRALTVHTVYIGCIGSRNKIAVTRQRLLERGFSMSEIDRLHAPIGLPILAETPAEIAISVAAELIRHRKESL